MIDLENVAEIEVEMQEAGPQGQDGLSAYEIYLKNGGTLTETEWLESLKGQAGTDGYTPVRNVDYWTEEDQTEIKNYCNDYINNIENLYDYTTATKIVGLRIDTGNSKIGEGAKKNTITYLEIESNTNYKVTKIAGTHFTVATCVDIPQLNVTLTKKVSNEQGTEISITSGTNDKYLVIYYYNTDDSLTEEEYRKTIKVTKENLTKLSQLENDSNFVNQEYVDNILGAINVELASLTEVAE